MRRRWVGVLIGAMLGGGVLSAATEYGPATSAAATPARADLRVARATVTVSPTTLRGTLTVRNAGRRRAPATTVTLAARPARQRARVLARVRVPALQRGTTRTIRFRAAVPPRLRRPATLRACADGRHRVRELREADNCRTIGRITVSATTPAPTQPTTSGSPTAPGAPTPAPTTPTPGPATPKPTNTVPAHPIAYKPGAVLALDSAVGRSWAVVPSTYDATHRTPIALLVWLHGCGGRSEWDVSTVAGGLTTPAITLAVGGRETGCWNAEGDQARVTATIADLEDHFNVDRRRIVIGGYSSGGNLAYRYAFTNAYDIAGVLALNTAPFSGTGWSQAQATAAAGWRFPVVHLAHTSDSAYPIDLVRRETDGLRAAGFPVQRVERPGNHYDDDTATSGTYHDLIADLLPHMADGWLSPP